MSGRTWRSAPQTFPLALAALAAGASFTPSLLPRTWYLQGMVAGFTAACAYLVGVFVVWLIRPITDWRPSYEVSRNLQIGVRFISPIWLAYLVFLGQGWQRELHLLLGLVPPGQSDWVRIVFLGGSLFIALVLLGRLFEATVRLTSQRLSRYFPNRLAAPVSVLVVITALVLVNNNLLWREISDGMDSSFAGLNRQTTAGSHKPKSALRSGSDASLVSWQSLGLQGRDFVSTGPSKYQLEKFSGQTAKRPIRIYVGLDSAESLSERAALAVQELQRTQAFDRAALLIVTTTGTGMVDPGAVEALEYLYNGDVATVSMQYSYLPSWFAFVVDGEKPKAAGKELFEAVSAQWQALPKTERPLLLVTGTSLGVLGGEAAFGSLTDLRSRTDGAVWAGAPQSSVLHSWLTSHRDAGSTEAVPVYQSGREVRFATSAADLMTNAGEWKRPRIVYLQNGSDPISKWSPSLLWSKPDWLSEPLPKDVLPQMTWLPIVTFWQVSADLPLSLAMPSGIGHNYRDEFVQAWSAVVPPQDWQSADTARLAAWLNRD